MSDTPLLNAKDYRVLVRLAPAPGQSRMELLLRERMGETFREERRRRNIFRHTSNDGFTWADLQDEYIRRKGNIWR